MRSPTALAAGNQSAADNVCNQSGETHKKLKQESALFDERNRPDLVSETDIYSFTDMNGNVCTLRITPMADFIFSETGEESLDKARQKK